MEAITFPADPERTRHTALKNRHGHTHVTEPAAQSRGLATARRILMDAKKAPDAGNDAAQKIIDVIKANGFCKTVA